MRTVRRLTAPVETGGASRLTRVADKLKPAYLIAGDDGAKLTQAVSRLRQRAEREGGEGSLEVFDPGPSGPDADALIGAIPAISLMSAHRYLLADGIEKWRAAQVNPVKEALASIPDDVTIVLVAHGKAPKGLDDAVKKAGGDLLIYEAPKKKELPGWVVETARAKGMQLSIQAARTLVARLGESTVRLNAELDRIALWAEPGAKLEADEIEELTADTSERAGWTLGDAIVDRNPRSAVVAADDLIEQGEAVTPMIYGMAQRLRNAHLAACQLEAGRAPRDVEAALPMAPYPSKLLVKAVRGVPSSELAEAIGRIADLEWQTRGGSSRDERTSTILAVREAAGAEIRA